MKKLSYLVIPLLMILVAVSGSFITRGGMDWYNTITKPSFTPPGQIIGMVWTTLFILQVISALIFWNMHKPHGSHRRNLRFWLISFVFLLSGVLNVLWSFLFFGQHLIYLAFLEAIVLGLSVLLSVILLWPLSKWAASLLIPYVLWVSFASYLTWNVWMLNQQQIT